MNINSEKTLFANDGYSNSNIIVDSDIKVDDEIMSQDRSNQQPGLLVEEDTSLQSMTQDNYLSSNRIDVSGLSVRDDQIIDGSESSVKGDDQLISNDRVSPRSGSLNDDDLNIQSTNGENIKSDTDSLVEDSAQWIAKHKKGWLHGFVKPWTVLKYDLVSSNSTKSRLSKVYDDVMVPQITLAEISTKSQPTLLNTRQNSEVKMSTDLPQVLRKEDPEAPFSAFYSIPKYYIVNANGLFSGKTFALPKVSFQNHFETDGLNYTFGGLYVSETSDLTYLGIPKETPMEKISVHFPCKPPPFVSEKLLANPLVRQNELFFKSNPVRNTLTLLGTDYSEESPYHLSSLEYCRIAKNHIFFFGGFSIEITAIDYKSEMDRWIIKKNLKLNHDGYILDTVTFKFSKIKLNLKTLNMQFGRLGSGITSTNLQTSGSLDLPERVPSPPLFTMSDSKNSAPTSPSNKSFAPKSQDSSTVLEVSIDSNDVSGQVKIAKTQSAPSTSPNPNTQPVANTHPTVYANLKQPKLDRKHKLPNSDSLSTSKSNDISLTKSNDTNPEGLPKLFTNFKSGSETSGTLNSNSATSQSHSSLSSATPPSAVSRMTNVFTKSSRLFHRNKHNNSHHNAPTPTNQLRNTYSKHLEKHRSNAPTGKTTSPRPTSPSSVTRSNTRLTTDTSSFSLEQTSKASIDAPRVANPITTRQYTTSLPNSSLSTFESKGVSTVDKSEVMDESFVRHQKRLFVEEVMKSGVDSTTIYVFGGFMSVFDDDGFQTFKATNALLTIEIPSKRKGKHITFDKEGCVNEIKPGNNDIWPTPRGFFARTVIKHNSGSGESCDIDVYQTLKRAEEGANTTESSTDSNANVTDDVLTDKDVPYVSGDSHLSSQSLLNGTVTNSQANFSLRGKVFFIQGGIDENYKSFSDFYSYVFDTGKWESMSTYAYDYFDIPNQPYEDEEASKLTKETEVKDPQLKDAELRACHHTVLYQESGEYDYLIFLGGFRNDLLRHYDKEKYTSDTFDVSRLAKLPFASDNNNILRIPILNLRTQTWKFVRYFYDIDGITGESYVNRIEGNQYWNNASLATFAGNITITEKKIVLAHGLVMPVPEKLDDFDDMKAELPVDQLFLGVTVQMTCPGL